MNKNAYAFYKKVRQYIEKHQMLAPGDGVVAGVSGGADSMCLLQLLCALRGEYGLRLAVVHVNHGIRGEAADEDEAFVRRECEKRGVLFRAVYADVPALAAEWSCPEEAAGRRVRYAAFRTAAAEYGCGRIAVAHNKNDNAETFLFQALRGSGLWGLSGIAPCRTQEDGGEYFGAGEDGGGQPPAPVVIRPLLCAGRAQIEEYLAAEGVDFRTDSTNLTGDYARNRIRNELLPLAERTVNAGAAEHLAAAAAEVRELSEFICGITQESYRKVAHEEAAERKCRGAACEEAAGGKCRSAACGEAAERKCRSAACEETAWKFCVPSEPKEYTVCIDIPAWRALPAFLQKEVVLYALGRAAGSRRDIGRAHVEAVCALMRGATGKSVNLPCGMLAARSYDTLRIVPEHMRESGGLPGDIGIPSGQQAAEGARTAAGTHQAAGNTRSAGGLPRLAPGSRIEIASLPASFALGEYVLTLRLEECGGPEGTAVPAEVLKTEEQSAPDARRMADVIQNSIANEKNSLNPKNCYTKWFDYGKISDTLVLRTRQAGDYIVIQKDGSKKSLKSVLIDKKVPRECREALPVLAAGSRVLWAVGVRSEEGLYVTENTKQILVAELKKKKG